MYLRAENLSSVLRIKGGDGRHHAYYAKVFFFDFGRGVARAVYLLVSQSLGMIWTW